MILSYVILSIVGLVVLGLLGLLAREIAGPVCRYLRCYWWAVVIMVTVWVPPLKHGFLESHKSLLSALGGEWKFQGENCRKNLDGSDFCFDDYRAEGPLSSRIAFHIVLWAWISSMLLTPLIVGRLAVDMENNQTPPARPDNPRRKARKRSRGNRMSRLRRWYQDLIDGESPRSRP